MRLSSHDAGEISAQMNDVVRHRIRSAAEAPTAYGWAYCGCGADGWSNGGWGGVGCGEVGHRSLLGRCLQQYWAGASAAFRTTRRHRLASARF